MKKRGFIGTIIYWIKWVILAALALAILPYFDWDIFKFIFWFFGKIWEIITILAGYFTKMEFLRLIFK